MSVEFKMTSEIALENYRLSSMIVQKGSPLRQFNIFMHPVNALKFSVHQQKK